MRQKKLTKKAIELAALDVVRNLTLIQTCLLSFGPMVMRMPWKIISNKLQEPSSKMDNLSHYQSLRPLLWGPQKTPAFVACDDHQQSLVILPWVIREKVDSTHE